MRLEVERLEVVDVGVAVLGGEEMRSSNAGFASAREGGPCRRLAFCSEEEVGEGVEIWGAGIRMGAMKGLVVDEKWVSGTRDTSWWSESSVNTC